MSLSISSDYGEMYREPHLCRKVCASHAIVPLGTVDESEGGGKLSRLLWMDQACNVSL